MVRWSLALALGVVSSCILSACGSTESPLAPAISAMEVNFVNPNVGWAFASDAGLGGGPTDVLRTNDGGQTWEPVLSNIPYNSSAVAFVDTQHAWVVRAPDSGGRWIVDRTSDGDQSWTTAVTPLPLGVRDQLRDSG